MTGLSKTWVLDLDGTIVKHNGYKLDGEDTLLDGALELLEQIKEGDIIEIEYATKTLKAKILTVPQGAVSVQQAPSLYEIIE